MSNTNEQNGMIYRSSPTVLVALKQIVVAIAITLVGQQAIAAEPSYTYRLEVNHNNDVCMHMQQVFNKSFRKMWDADPLWSDDDPRYSESSRYAFPLLNGIEHNGQMTFDMRYSKVRSSPEFDAIEWKEGRAIFGDPPETAGPVSKVPMPILVAHFDFDNDGQVDTVIKNGFNRGYSYMAGGHGGVGLFEESIMILRSQQLEVPVLLSLWEMQNKLKSSKQLVDSVSGSYIRPFIYKKHTYVAQYDMDKGEGQAMQPYKILKETMKILDFRLSGEFSKYTAVPLWAHDIVCEYKMNQVKK